MDAAFEFRAFTLLAGVAALLMLTVTSGVIYLTAAEWRDRRRRKRDQDSTRRSPTKRRK